MEVLEEVDHRQLVWTIPKALRSAFRRDRQLLGELCRCAGQTLREYVGRSGSRLYSGRHLRHTDQSTEARKHESPHESTNSWVALVHDFAAYQGHQNRQIADFLLGNSQVVSSQHH